MERYGAGGEAFSPKAYRVDLVQANRQHHGKRQDYALAGF
jgi:hypothetical protein